LLLLKKTISDMPGLRLRIYIDLYFGTVAAVQNNANGTGLG